MFYELKTAWKTIRKEGLGSLFTKIRIYFGDLMAAINFLFAKRPSREPDAIIKFIWETSRGLIRPGQAKSELSSLLGWMDKNQMPRTILEIGTASGGTLFCWCAMAAPDATVISLDLPGGIHGGGYPYWKTFLYRRFAHAKQQLHLLRGNSHELKMLEAVKKLLPTTGLDFLFIDGDHTLDGVRRDYEMFSPLVKSGGTIVFHDICAHRPEFNCHVDKFWNEIKQGHDHWEFIENSAQGYYGIGVIVAKQADSNDKK